MDKKKLTIMLAENGKVYAVTALYMNDTQSWSVMLKVDGVPRTTLPYPEFPATFALQLIADAQLEAYDEVYEAA